MNVNDCLTNLVWSNEMTVGTLPSTANERSAASRDTNQQRRHHEHREIGTETVGKPVELRRMSHLFSMPPEKGARTAVFLPMSPDVAGIAKKPFEKNRELAGLAAAPLEAR